MTTPSPQSFRNAFWLHPRAWVAEHGEVAAGTLMDVAENDGRDSPALRERLSLAAHAVTLHAEAFMPHQLRSLAASISLGIGWAVASVHLVLFALLPYLDERTYSGGGSFVWASLALCGPWITAGILGSVRHPALARRILVFAAVVPVAVLASRSFTTTVELPATMLSILLTGTAFVAFAGRVQPRLVARSGGVTTVALIGVLAYSGLLVTPNEWFLWGTVAWENLPALLTMCLTAIITLLFTRQQRAAGILALITIPWVGVELGLVWRTGDSSALLVTVITVVLLIGAALTVKVHRKPSPRHLEAQTAA